MSYYSNGVDYKNLAHTLTIKGPIKTDAAKLLLECEEALAKLGYITTLNMQIYREAYAAQTEDALTAETV